MVPSSELLNQITTRYPSVTRASDELNDTARSWKIPGYEGSFGFISSMSDHFCGTCNRLRITADGQIKVRRIKLIGMPQLTTILHRRCACSMQKKSPFVTQYEAELLMTNS